jgi:hypothetical protein
LQHGLDSLLKYQYQQFFLEKSNDSIKHPINFQNHIQSQPEKKTEINSI